jgi:uracil-DNA glycosylase family 4
VRPDAFVEALAAADFGQAFNFYRRGEGAELRRSRLLAYLEARADAPILLVGEAPGYRGTRISGIPFTSERQLSGREPGEATATVVHRVLAELGIEDETLLWNAVPAHPHLPGRPLTNRRPTRSEVISGQPFLAALARGRRVIAVGRVAGAALGLPNVRHPARGGATAFRAGLLESGLGGRLVRRFVEGGGTPVG